ncbi:MAG: FtsX-like permease family protein [Brevinematia bacterium]
MSKIFLFFKEMRGNLVINLLLLLVIFISTLLMIIFTMIILNLSSYVDKRFSKLIAPDLIKVSPKVTRVPRIGLFGIQFKQPKGTYIDDSVLREIKRIKGVVEVNPLLASRIPMQVMVSIFGLNYGSDLICIGVDYNFVANDIPDRRIKKLWNSWKSGMDVPVLIPEILFQAYNSSMAEPNNLPKVTKEMITGVRVRLNVGRSSLKTLQGNTTENGVVVGFTDKVANICLVIPIEVMRFFNKKFGVKSEYIHLFVRVKDHNSLLSVSKQIKSMGLQVESDKIISEEILKLKNLISIAGNLLIIIVMFIASVSIAFGSIISVNNRFEYYKILRILGASRSFIAFSIILKYAILGFIAGFISVSVFENVFKILLSRFSLTGYVMISTLKADLKRNIILFSTFLPAVSSLFGILKLYNHKELVID